MTEKIIQMEENLTLIESMSEAGVAEHILEPTKALIVENNNLKFKLAKIEIYLIQIKSQVDFITTKDRDTIKWSDLDASFNVIKNNANLALET
jgi:hypothetical protein